MNAALPGQAGPLHRQIENRLPRALGQRLLPVPPEKEPRPGLNRPPVSPQLLKQPRRKQRVAVLAPLALLNSNEHARAVNVRRFEVARLAEAQPRPIHRHEKGPVLGMEAAGGEHPFHLPHAEDLRPAHRLLDRRQAQPQLLHRPMEHQLVEGAQGTDRLVQRRGRQPPLLRQIENILLELLITQPVRWLVVMPGQAVNRRDVALLCSGGNPSYNEFPNELLTQCPHPQHCASLRLRKAKESPEAPPRSGLVQQCK